MHVWQYWSEPQREETCTCSCCLVVKSLTWEKHAKQLLATQYAASYIWDFVTRNIRFPCSTCWRGKYSNLIIHIATSIMVSTNKLNALICSFSGFKLQGSLLILEIKAAKLLPWCSCISCQNSPYLTAKAASTRTTFASQLYFPIKSNKFMTLELISPSPEHLQSICPQNRYVNHKSNSKCMHSDCQNNKHVEYLAYFCDDESNRFTTTNRFYFSYIRLVKGSRI